MRNAGSGQWAVENLTLPITSHGYKSAIAIDGAGVAHIAFLFRNQSDNAELRYVSNATGNWVVESPAGNEEIGPYGADFSAPRLSQGSLDIEFKADGEPFITYYDGSANLFGGCAFTSGPVYINYDLELKVAERESSGSWQLHDFPDIPNKNFPGCLNQGDRFGEFCQILPKENGQYLVMTNSVHNHELLLFRSAVNDLSSWEYQVIDSFRSVLGGTEDFFDTFEAPRAVMSGDSLIYLLTSGSVEYGFSNRPNRNFLAFYQLDQDSVGAETYSITSREVIPNLTLYRSYVAITSRHPDSIYQVFVDVRDNTLQLQYSFDGGNIWEADTLGTFLTSTRMETHIIGDSLYIWGSDERKNAIAEIALPLDVSTNVSRYATINESRARIQSSFVDRQGNTDVIASVYIEDFRDRLLYSTNESGVWKEEEVTSAESLVSLKMITDDTGAAWVAYTAGDPEQTILMRRVGGTWSSEVVSTIGLRGLSMIQAIDSIFVVGNDLATGELRLYSRPVSGTLWNSTVMSNSGEIPVMRSSGDTLHVAYENLGTNQVIYRYRVSGGPWEIEEVSSPQNYNPQALDLQISPNGTPFIVFKDGKTDEIFLAEPEAGTWIISEVPTDPGNLIGAPLKLIVDSKNRPWVLYNFPDIQDELRLTRRSGNGVWFGVSVLNNQKQIANEFDFHLVEDDFYVIGRKNEAADQGIGLLFAQEGVRTRLIPEEQQLPVTLVPNPTNGLVESTIEINATGEMFFRVYNLQGQIVHNEVVYNPGGSITTVLDLRALSAGRYLVQVIAGGKSGVENLLLLE